ncbi:MAG: DUF2855 family protein [Bacteroidota bacterium]
MPKLQAGEVLFKIDKYAFTSNNITYAVAGDRIKYWDFFPANAPWGIVPVWGYAEVVASENGAIKTGERCFGYFPMSDYLIVTPGNIKPHGFADISEHRSHLAPIYNFYTSTSKMPGFQKEKEDYLPIIRPLFATAFLIYYFLKDNDFFNTENIVLTSASSKTALGLAYMLNANKKEDGKKIIGLTSSRNIDFVKSNNYYDDVISYEDAIGSVSDENTVIIDFAGNAGLLNGFYQKLNDALKHVALIGLTDWSADKNFNQIPVAQFFFAPTHIQNKYKEWGAEKTNLLLGQHMMGFISDMEKHLEISLINDQKSLQELFGNMLKGDIDPSKGYIVSLK